MVFLFVLGLTIKTSVFPDWIFFIADSVVTGFFIILRKLFGFSEVWRHFLNFGFRFRRFVLGRRNLAESLRGFLEKKFEYLFEIIQN
mmetsp:Transcript_55029/g.83293  ORF Transcript_55029/g.83293 Transcript_55029/m.83293 type:complete len:87 (-) Transcript_55029:20-280(-)